MNSPNKTRQDQYADFNFAVARLLMFAIDQHISIRFGEAYRNAEQAAIYAKAGTGTLDSRHRYSLAVDLWITEKNGLGIAWKHPDYSTLGRFWKELGHIWGGDFKKYNDVYHFEYKEKPLKK